MERKWWKEAVVYQIYPRSFYDSNGDGIGDIRGIIVKLDYLKYLGVDVVWLCPVYASPNDDNGYDISDYYKIMGEFGTMQDLEELLAELHKRDMKLIMDLVVNHTSDEHPWFIEARSSSDSEKRDYYIWKPGQNGKEPNNWKSYFGGSVWEWDEISGEYYLHLFSKKQPDLNWRNPRVKQEIFAMLKWWLDKSVDGFRMDVINLLSKPEGLPDSQRPVPDGEQYVFDEGLYANQPGMHELLKEMNDEIFSKYDCMTVGETVNVNVDQGLAYTGADRKELNMIFQFELMGLDMGPGGKFDDVAWNLDEFKKIIIKWQTELHNRGWNSLFLNNHDNPRAVSRFGNDGPYWAESAKMLATLNFTLQGTPYIYQGEEIGMTNVKLESIAECRDIESLNFYKEKVVEKKEDPSLIMGLINKKGRDNARTPMQWNNETNAGFSDGTPWLKVNPNYKDINVQKAMAERDSVLNYYRKLIRLRKENLTLVYGEFIPVTTGEPGIFAYIRQWGEQQIFVVMNFSEVTAGIKPVDWLMTVQKELLISNYAANGAVEDDISLMPYEVRVYIIR